MTNLHRKLLLTFVLLAATLGFAQSPTQGTLPDTPMYKDISLTDLGIILSVPIVSKPGIGTSFNVGLQYNNNSWVTGGQYPTYSWTPNTAWISYGLQVGGYMYGYEDDSCPYPPLSPNPIYPIVYTGYTDPQGGYHNINPPVYILQGGPPNLCHNHSQVDHTTFVADDKSGLTFNLSWSNGANVVTPSGRVWSTNTSVDLYGNTTSLGVNGWTDTVGVNELTRGGTYPTSVTYSYPTTSGPNTATVTQTSVLYNIATNFGCSSYGEYNWHGYLVDHFTFADESTESFTYESQVANTVTGRVASVTYPDGSVVNYSYGPMNCNGPVGRDVGPLSITRTDAMGATTITYNSATSTTVVSPAPASNKTVYTFVGAYPYKRVTQIQEYQGSGGNPLRTTTVCYNNVLTNCPTTDPGQVVWQKDVYTLYAGMSGSSRSTTKFDNYGNVTETDTYDFGASSPAFKTIASNFGYSWNGSTCVAIGSGVNNVPCTVESYDINGTPIAYATFQYNSKGSLLSRSTLVSGNIVGGRYLTTSYSYNTNGTVYQSFEANGKATTNTYGDCNGGGLTKTVYPISALYTQFNHDSGCYGFVGTSVTTPDGQTAYAAFTDPLWRPTSKTDQASNVINLSYPTASPYNWSETNLTFGSVVVDNYIQRNTTANPPTSYLQAEDIPNSGWDSVTIGSSWGSTGITSSTSLPCLSSTKGSPCTSATATVTHDALGRPLVATDGGGGTIINSYILSGNWIDTLTVRGPAPAGEVVKQVQREYNGLGQLLSECFLSSATGTTSCGQVNGGTGFLNTYSYNSNGTLASVTRGVQSHTFTYDVSGRTLTAAYPEGGTKQFFYDSAPSTPGVACSTLSLPTNVTPLGHLLKTYDANGTTACFSYDAMGRNIGIAYAGAKVDGENKYFVYDSATVNSVSMVNTAGRLAEAYTAPTISGTKVTDEGFSYGVRGELSDVYQWSTNSGGWYHTGATYTANGVPATLTGVPNGTWTFTPDGKGRPSVARQGSNTMTSSVTYNAANQPLVTTLGLGDTDTYTYDPNTGRMTIYAFSIGATPKVFTGSLTWNANGTLRGLATVDGINSGSDTETCDYGNSSNTGYDEFGRLLRVNCLNSGGTLIWGQAFTYDQYNNLTKTASAGISWIPGYNQNNNQYMLAGTTYDSNGNLLTDTFHTYTWNQDNHVLSIADSGISNILYDALGRKVEWKSGSQYKQMLLSPLGPVGTMIGQSVNQFRVPLPGGDTAISNVNFDHRDWLGTASLVSNRNRTATATRLFAPYGEVYNNVGSTGAVDFTGDFQDFVAGTYDTPNREENSNQGRWLSPDPARAAWNAYQYSTNPMGETDPTGLNIINPDLRVCKYIDCVNSGMATGGSRIVDGNEEYTGDNPNRLFPTGDLESMNRYTFNYSVPMEVSSANLIGTVSATGYVSGVPTPVAPCADNPGGCSIALRYADFHRRWDDFWQKVMCSPMCGLNVIAATPFINDSGTAQLVRVGRWMSADELKKMQATGRVQESTLNGVTSVTVPPDPAAYKDAAPENVFVEFKVPSDSVRALTENGWAKIYGPNSLAGNFYGVTEMPEATDIEEVPIE